MPISSGANSWPASYWHKPVPKTPNPKLVVVDTGRTPSPPPRKPSPPPPSPPPPPPQIETEEIVHIERRGSPPPPRQRVYVPPSTNTQHITHIIERPPPPPPPPPPSFQRQMTIINRQPPPPRQLTFINRQPPPQQMGYMTKPPLYPNQTRMVNHGYREYGGYSGYQGYGGGGFCGDGGGCCADSSFSNSMYGANTGCCQGGMFGSRSYPYSEEQMYMVKGTGRGRCCACVWGLILGLLLLGLLIGLLAGLMPALQKKSAQSSVVKQFSGGYFLNGVYYYKITNPPDIFYWAMGPSIPCNPYNNNTLVSPTVGYTTEIISSTVFTHIVTQGPQFTLPNCNSIVTSYILANGISVSTTTINPFLLLTSSASSICTKMFVSMLASLFVRLYLG